jgi:hypothetical protein
MTIVVSGDGSATVIDTALFSRSTVSFFDELVNAVDSTGASESPTMWSDSSLQSRATTMGNNIVFLSATKIQIDSFIGYTALYKAAHVSDLQIDKSAFHSRINEASQQDATPNAQAHFVYTDHMLTILNPPYMPHYEPSDTTLNDTETLQQLESAQLLLADLSVSIRIRISGTIVETNAQHLAGNDITLIDFHFAELIDSLRKNPDIFRIMRGTPNQQAGDLERAMNRLGPGAAFETQERVYVRFKE